MLHGPMVGWRVLAISRVAKRSRSLKRLGGSVSSSSWEAERVFYVLATRARTCGYNELHFGGKKSQAPTVIRGTVLQNLHICRCVETDERKPIICHGFWGRSGFKVDS